MYTKWHSKCPAERKIATTNSFGFVTRAKQICRQREDVSPEGEREREREREVSPPVDAGIPAGYLSVVRRNRGILKRYPQTYNAHDLVVSLA